MSEWISVDTKMPFLEYENEDDPDVNGYPQFHGYVSQSVEITDGTNWARGHYRDDSAWIIYGAEYDFLIVKPEDITHWQPMIKLPK
tara:strand:- start:1688 stop:1945 length:258 start_codon:yes stop_codon:yes gene_type:complete